MNEALQLMEQLESIDHGLSLEGDKLRIMRGKHLPPSFREKVLLHKNQLLTILKYDVEAKAAHFLVGIPGTMYMRTFNRFTTVYIEREADKWLAWRETYQHGRTTASGFKSIAPPSSFAIALLEAERYLDYIEKPKEVNS